MAPFTRCFQKKLLIPTNEFMPQVSILKHKIIFFLISFCTLCAYNKAIGQIRTDADEEHKRLYYDYTARVKKFKDMKDFRDVFHYNKYLLGKRRIMGNIFYDTGRVLVDDGQVVHSEMRNAIGFFTRIRFFEEFYIN